MDAYEDEALGVMKPNEQGRQAITTVTLRPRVVFSGERRPGDREVAAMHEEAHKECFIASSVRTDVRCEWVRSEE